MSDQVRYAGIFILFALLCLKLYKIYTHYFKKARVDLTVEGPATSDASPHGAGVVATLIPPRPVMSAGERKEFPK